MRLGVFELDCACGDAFIVLRASQRGLLTRGPRAAAQAAAFYGQGCPAPPDFCARRFAPPLGRVVTCSWHLGCVCTGRGRVRCPDELAVFAGRRRTATRWSRRAGAGRACGMGDGRAFGGALSIWKGAFLAMRAWALPNGRRDPAVLLAEGHGRRRALLLPELISLRRAMNGDWWFVKAAPGSLLAGAASHKVTMHRQHSHHKCFYYFSSSFHRHAPTSVEASRRPLATNG